jgi:phytoene dehydrogenase-like protein
LKKKNPNTLEKGLSIRLILADAKTIDDTESIERQIVRFAPEFRDCILSRSVSTPEDLESWNSNLVGGDILGEQ